MRIEAQTKPAYSGLTWTNMLTISKYGSSLLVKSWSLRHTTVNRLRCTGWLFARFWMSKTIDCASWNSLNSVLSQNWACLSWSSTNGQALRKNSLESCRGVAWLIYTSRRSLHWGCGRLVFLQPSKLTTPLGSCLQLLLRNFFIEIPFTSFSECRPMIWIVVHCSATLLSNWSHQMALPNAIM